MNYFKQLEKNRNLLAEAATVYTDQFKDGLSIEDMCIKIWNWCWCKLEGRSLDDGSVWIYSGEHSDYILNQIDCGVILSSIIPENGSLKFTLGFSIEALEANVRNEYQHYVLGKDLLPRFQTLADDPKI